MAGSQYHYDVFFSVSPHDLNRTDHLYKALVDSGLRIFRDGDPMVEWSGDIKSDVKKAIERSKFAVIVVSGSFASSKWCLDQLVMIFECKRNAIRPVFYDAGRLEVGSQTGGIGEAFVRYEEELKVETDDQRKEKLTDKIEGWREALSFAAEVPGLVLQNQVDGDLTIQKFIEAIEEKVKAVQEDFVPKEAETEIVLLNQEPLSLDEEWTAVEITLKNIEELPENPSCPVLVKLFLQQSYDLTEIPDSFFKSMPVLQVLDLSNTSIKTLPQSIASLVELRQFFLRGCVLLRELPPNIGELKNLEVFDLEGTELMCLPEEIRGLLKLECLKLSLYRCADNYIERKGIKAILPRATLSKFSQLKELGIHVDPDCEWWDTEVEAIINELAQLRNLGTLKLFFPTVEMLQKFLQLPGNVYQNLSNFRLTVGRHEQHVISSLPHNLQSRFEKLDKCLKYVNGKGNMDGIGKALEHARALFLDRQWTIEKLSAFKIDEMHQLNFCLVVECNEMNTIVDGSDFYQERDNGGKGILGSLRYLSVHYMKNLQSIWKGPFVSHCLSFLEILVLHTCPELTMIFNLALLRNLVNLKELIVENCPKVKILISADPSCLEADFDFLPALEKILIVDLPELVSISGGLRFGPKLESIVFSNCPMLENLSPTDMYSKYMHDIKDESEWSEALDLSISETDYLQHVLVPVTSYDDFTEVEKISGDSLYQNPFQNQVTGIEGLILNEDVKEDKLETILTKTYLAPKLEQGEFDVHWSWVPEPTKNLEPSLPRSFVSLPRSFVSLPRSLVNLSLVDCNLRDDSFPMDFGSIPSLRMLDLSSNSFTTLPQLDKKLVTLELLQLDGCKKLRALPELPSSLRQLYVANCSSLERLAILRDVVENSFLPFTMKLYGCKKLVEVDCMFILEPIENFNAELMNSWGLDDLEFVGNVVVELCNNLTLTRMKRPIQGLYEFGIFSTFLPLGKIPSFFSNKSFGSSISFTVPSSHNLKLRAMNICVVYACSNKHERNHFYDFYMKVSNTTKGLEWTYGPTFYGNGDMTWLSHWDIVGGIEVGDEVNVLVVVGLGFEVKECGTNLVYEEEEQVIQNGMYTSYLSALGAAGTCILCHYDMGIPRGAYNECTIVTPNSMVNFKPPRFSLVSYVRRNLPRRTTSQLISWMTRGARQLLPSFN